MGLKIFLLLISATLVGSGVWMKLEERKEILAAVEALNKRWVPDFNLNSVTEVLIKTNEDSVVLCKKGEKWVVNGEDLQEADIAAIGRLVLTIKNLKPTEQIIVTPSQLGSFDLLEPGAGASGVGTLVELHNKEAGRLAAIIIGKQSFARPDPKSPFPPPPNGRFIIQLGSEGPVVVVSEGFDGISPKAAAWLRDKPR